MQQFLCNQELMQLHLLLRYVDIESLNISLDTQILIVLSPYANTTTNMNFYFYLIPIELLTFSVVNFGGDN